MEINLASIWLYISCVDTDVTMALRDTKLHGYTFFFCLYLQAKIEISACAIRVL